LTNNQNLLSHTGISGLHLCDGTEIIQITTSNSLKLFIMLEQLLQLVKENAG